MLLVGFWRVVALVVLVALRPGLALLVGLLGLAVRRVVGLLGLALRRVVGVPGLALRRVVGLLVVPVVLLGCSPAPEVEQPELPSSAFAYEQNGVWQVSENTVPALRFNWHYQRFLEHLVNASGRVIDSSGERSISTSEGQAYGMWFALLAQDRTQFDLMLTWADRNLAEGALGDRLPAWLWGEDEDGRWHILDNNPASDADVWMTYALFAAAERWNEPRYQAIAERLSRRLLTTTTQKLGSLMSSSGTFSTPPERTGSLMSSSGTFSSPPERMGSLMSSSGTFADGLVLLPAPFGFVHDEYVLVNPSYFSLVQFRGLAAYSGDERWLEVYETSIQILQQLANEGHGVVPDWLAVTHDGKVLTVEQTPARHQADVRDGDYDAIRTYLWLAQAGLVEKVHEQRVNDPNLEKVHEQRVNDPNFGGVYRVVQEQGYPPERLQRPEPGGVAVASGRGGIGFSAVLLAYLAAIEGPEGEEVREQMARIVAANPNDYRDRYYTQMLLMFGLSALQCTQFHSDGRLNVSVGVLNGCT